MIHWGTGTIKQWGFYLKSKIRVSFKKCSQQSPANLARFIGIGKPIWLVRLQKDFYTDNYTSVKKEARRSTFLWKIWKGLYTQGLYFNFIFSHKYFVFIQGINSICKNIIQFTFISKTIIRKRVFHRQNENKILVIK